ncbi:laminin subunit alpha-like, partial [Limulus polyphemus]|uniref:Laminin subunit alpha-like n=1 Tax=Limulus polyphemus TaxID=6850 RepID=A0ABM1C0C7_LIMPO
FAVSCEVSESGLEISCNCKPGYTGPRCGSCSAGYFGQPQVLGSYCQSCNCSGNSKSCDSITGECHSCLNNTFGTACELCASGFYGDAVFKKDCKKCECNECGTDRCDHRIGVCHCKPNVVGMACDDCDVGFWGFKSCVGCQGCNCGPASEDNNCDVETGQCKCRPGTTGLTCDSCKPGYWQYSPEGCVSCNCVEKYSLPGAVCDVASGECQCLPGVVGTNCQGCLYRWTFIENQGCQECGPCVHALLDETDYLQSLIDPIRDEMTDISASYFAYRRLHNVNKTVDDLRPEVNALIFDPTAVDLSPLHYNVRSVEDQAHQLNNSADKGVKEAEEVSMNADKTREEALEVEKLIQDAVKKARDTVGELTALAEGLLDTAGPNLDKLIARAERILQEIKDRDFMSRKNDTEDELELAEELLEHVKNFQKPAILNKERAEELDEQLNKLNELLEELRNHSRDAEDVAQETLELNEAIRQANVTGIIAAINQLAAGTNKTLDEAKELLEAAKKALEDAETAFSKLDLDSSRLARAIDELKEKLNGQEEELDEVRPLVDEAKKHASDLMEQAALLDSLLADTRDSADGAVKAATAYGNIVDAIDDALKAAQAAVEAANQAAELSDGMAGRAEGSKNRSIELLEEAQKLQKKVEDGKLFLKKTN